MAILRDDLTKRESRAEAGDPPGEADSAAPSTKALFSHRGSGRGKGRKPRPYPCSGRPVPSPSAARPPGSSAGSASAESCHLSISGPDAARRGVGVAPENSRGRPCVDLGGPLQGGSGEEEKPQRLEACARGSETAVILVAPFWEPETLARTMARTRREEAQRGQLPFLLLSDLSPWTWLSPNCQRDTFPLPFLLSLLHLRRVGEEGRGKTGKVVTPSNFLSFCPLRRPEALTCGGSSPVQNQLNGGLLQPGCGR